MNTILKITLAVVGIGFMLVLLLFGTFFVRQVAYAMPMNWRTPFYNQSGPGPFPPGSDYRGMWGRGGMHPGTGSFQMPWGQNGCRGYDDGYGWGDSTSVEPISIDAAQDAVEKYIKALGYGDLEIGESMIFSNHAYVQIIETDTGIGAMEVLVDPVSSAVYPEFGPNMMWNIKYGMHAGSAPGRGYEMMGGFNYSDFDLSEPMEIGAEEAASIAQDYLARVNSPLTVDDHGDQFYGYYTFHTLNNGQIEGMLSINGYTGEVFIHSWHGEFLEMEHAHG